MSILLAFVVREFAARSDRGAKLMVRELVEMGLAACELR